MPLKQLAQIIVVKGLVYIFFLQDPFFFAQPNPNLTFLKLCSYSIHSGFTTSLCMLVTVHQDKDGIQNKCKLSINR